MSIFNSKKVKFSVICCVFLTNICVAMSVSGKQNCDQLPLRVLKRLHGAAFDSRYMSINEPKDSDNDNLMDDTEDFDRKRSADHRPSFYIGEEHTIELSDQPAWKVQWDALDEQPGHTRKKRSPLPIGYDVKPEKSERQNMGIFKEIKCEKRVKWIHLGADYHPPHLRTIECTKSTCFYSHGNCRPRFMPVRILKRRRGACADASILEMYGFAGKQAEVWEWIEVSVNFCCDCVAPQSFYQNNS